MAYKNNCFVHEDEEDYEIVLFSFQVPLVVYKSHDKSLDSNKLHEL